MRIESKNIFIDPNTKIADNVDIIASDSLHIGPYTLIGSNFKVICRSLYIGTHCYVESNCVVGGGGCHGPNANVFIDDFTGLMEGTYINCAESVTIGKHCGIGQEVNIWTHGAWLPVIDGFPKQKQEPVKIGDKVWIPARTQVLAGVEIGNNVVIGINSVVNKSLPAGCFAAGIPAIMLKENVYPRPLSDDELHAELKRLCDIYFLVAEDKGFKPKLTIDRQFNILFEYADENVLFNPRTAEFKPGKISDFAEDFRDFLRRNGFGFYGGGFFRSLKPKRFLDLRNYKPESLDQSERQQR